MHRIGFNHCPYCGEKEEIYPSRPRTLWEEACGFLFLQLVRCHFCMYRHYRPLFMPLVPTVAAKKPVQRAAAEEQRERSA
jgi:hypothetical protein